MKSYAHPENKNKKFIDWRDLKYRKEGFLRWLEWRIKWNDLDHYMYANTYRDAVGERSPTGLPMTVEQELWYCLIFGCTYQTEMAWVIYWNFPNFYEIDFTTMKKWSDDNYVAQKYARDTKYNKGKIAEQVLSMQKIIYRHGSIKKWLDNFLDKDPNISYENIFKEALKIHKYGRMTTWLFCQMLHEVAGVDLKPSSMLATDPSNWSVRSGILYLYGLEEKIGQKLHSDDLKLIAQYEQEIFEMAKGYLSPESGRKLTNFLLESHLCQYKKLMLGGDYAGHSTGDHYSRGSILNECWPSVNFDAFFEDAITKQNPLVQRKYESTAMRNVCKETGQLVNMHLDYPDLPNMYLETGIDPDWLLERKTNEKKIYKCITTYKREVFGGEKN